MTNKVSPEEQAAIDKFRDSVKGYLDHDLMEKFGDPFDDSDIRNALPSERRTQDPNMSIEDELRYLALDIEAVQKILSMLVQDFFRKRAEDYKLNQMFESGGYL